MNFVEGVLRGEAGRRSRRGKEMVWVAVKVSGGFSRSTGCSPVCAGKDESLFIQ